jgi:hypothetical protein
MVRLTRAPWLAVLLSSALLFVVQPLTTKMVLPGFGGAASTWTVVSLFFQMLLLLGYGYAVALRTLSSRKAELAVHGLAAIAAVLLVNADLSQDAADPAAPIASLLLTLSMHLGAPVLVLCATGPLMQTWWRDAHSVDRPGPATQWHPLMFLAAGSVGSIGSILAYVWWLEPRFDSDVLARWWQVALAAVLLLVLWCGVRLRRDGDRDHHPRDEHGHGEPADAGGADTAGALPISRFVQWMMLAGYASALPLATTTHLSHDIAAVPLLWIGPLVGLLVAYALAFSPWRDRVRKPAQWAQLLLTPMALLALRADLPAQIPLMAQLALHLATCSVVTLVAVAQLSVSRGDVRHLGEYNMALALGGALGGFVVAVVAPVVLPVVIEYPVLLLAGFWVGRDVRSATWQSWLVFAGFTLLWLDSTTEVTRSGVSIYRARSFFGAYNVRRLDTRSPSTPVPQHLLYHGTTLHGRQYRADSLRRRALGYYTDEGPIGRMLHALDSSRLDRRRVLVVGLGTGALSCTLHATGGLTFLEIDPLIVRIARDTSLFSYLADCAPGARIIVGDARVSLRQLRGERFDLIVLDAFSSDAVPVHLLTKEAYRAYASLLSSHGTIVTHVSNRYLTLQPVVNAAGAALHLYVARGDPTYDDLSGRYPDTDLSWWVALTPNADTHAAITTALGWTPVYEGSRRVWWSDRRSSVLDVISKR